MAIGLLTPLGCDGGDEDGSGGASASSAASTPSSSAVTTPSATNGAGSGTSTTGADANGSGQNGSGQTGETSGAGCTAAEDCPGGDACRIPACDAGACTESFAPQGTPAGGDEPGDCRRLVCDGAGNVETVSDDADLPADDGRECTIEACAAGVPSSSPKPAGTLCSEDDGRFCSAAGTCQFCPPTDAACTDAGPGEPNDSQGQAFSFGEIGDDDDLGMHVCGVLASADAEDWYTYTGRDELFAEVGPGRSVGGQDDLPAGSLRICKFVACIEGPTTFTCPGGTTAEVAPGGQQGCCAPGDVDISDDFLDDLCSATGDDDAQVWIRVERIGDAACVPYDLDFHY